MFIRPEQPDDSDSIKSIIVAAFSDHPYSRHNEQRIVDALRVSHALTVSLVAIESNQIVGHVACSPISIDGKASNWFGLGPVAVRPDSQGRGIGAALVRASVDQLAADNAQGIVVLGEPQYYERFGFTARPDLILPGAPAAYFLCLPLRDAVPTGVVSYHDSFAVA